MRENTANKTVFVIVIFAPVDVHNLTDFFCSEVFIFFYLKMKGAEDFAQSS